MSITIGVAGATWLAGWLGGNIAATIVLSLTGQASTDAALRSVWASAVTTVALWVPQIIALVIASRRFGTGRILRDYAVRFRPVDLVGLPIGVLSQLVLLRLVYWPLQTMWPGAFSTDELERNARDLYERASGVWVVVLFAVVTVGAPLVEELVYRGLLGGAARRRFHEVVALVGVAAFFALIHFRPVEYPGLFAFGLVLGVCLAATNRIGMGILAHVAFNATALALIA
ncbi:MAG: CPBP family intramembrane glutamic endopeptidase [Ilumatobacteraceae bacterium]